MMSANDTTLGSVALLDKWHGQLVPWSYEGGFIALSFVVSLIGAATTLELIQRRTAQTGKLNNVLLVGAAISMGGVAIWSMHYVGNRSIIIADGESQLQISYSSSFTVLSLFVPIFVLLAAFVAAGTKDRVSWWRIGIGGTLSGLAICGMHYLGNASISNYSCEYDLGNVIAAAIIAVVASSVALAIFFVFRATWTSAWWKRTISEIILAGAVSGMHWCASGGTHYRLIALKDGSNGELDRNTTVIIVICLAVGASILMGAMAIYLAYIMKRYASRAQKIQLAAAIFDDQGRVLVNRDGLLPCEKITDSFFEKTPRDALSNAHPLFHWMYQVSRNWHCVAPLMEGMSAHLAQLSRDGTAKGGIQLVTGQHEPVQDYDNIVRELFCVTAATLAARLKINLEDLGVLWDEILNTGGAPLGPPKNDSIGLRDDPTRNPADVGLAEKGFRFRVEVGHDAPRGSLLFLVRKIQTNSDMEALEAAGFRFAELHQVSNNISSKMQIRTRELEVKLRNMALQTEQNTMLEPGVHLGLFGIRSQSGVVEFDVMARKGATNLLPSVAMEGIESLEESEKVFLAQLDRMSINAMLQVLRNGGIPSAKDTSAFAEKLADALRTLRGWVDDPVLAEAMVTSKVVEVPSSPLAGTNIARTATMIALRIVIPTSHKLSDHSRCELVPLGLFRVQQISYKGSPHQAAFAQNVRREIAPLVDHLIAQENNRLKQSSRNRYTKLDSPRKDDQSEMAIEITPPGNSRPATPDKPEKKLAMWTHWRKAEPATRDIERGDKIPDSGSAGMPERMSSVSSSGMALKRSNSSLSLWRGAGDRSNSIGDIRATSSHGSVGGTNGAMTGVTALGLPTCGKCGRHGGAPVSLQDDDDRLARRSCCSVAAARAAAAASASAPSNNNSGNGSKSKSHGDVVEMKPLASPRSGHTRGDSGGATSLTSNGSVDDGSEFHGTNGSTVEAARDISTFVDELFTMRKY
ncbi:hypothetical protein ACKVV7_006562 [Pyricularia oryzae]